MSRQPRQSLNRTRVIEGAIRVADAGGVEAVGDEACADQRFDHVAKDVVAIESAVVAPKPATIPGKLAGAIVAICVIELAAPGRLRFSHLQQNSACNS